MKGFILAEGKFMPALNLKQPGFNYSAFGQFTKICERVKKFRETGSLKDICRKEIDKA